MKPIILYYSSTPNCFKISIMLEEIQYPYEIERLDLSKVEQFSDTFTTLSMNNKVPAIVDPEGPDGKPLSIFESGAILQYLGRKSGKLYPADESKRTQVDQWLFWQVGGIGPISGQNYHFRSLKEKADPYALERYTQETKRLYSVMDRRLKEAPYLANDYSIADIACVGWIKNYAALGQDLAHFPHISRWLKSLLARPSVQKGLEPTVSRLSN